MDVLVILQLSKM